MVWNRGSLLAWLIVSLLIVARAGPAWGQQARFPVTDDQRQTAEKVGNAGRSPVRACAGAPERYTIKKGDTLWAISVLYLKSPCALARAVGHEPEADRQSSPDLSGSADGAP